MKHKNKMQALAVTEHDSINYKDKMRALALDWIGVLREMDNFNEALTRRGLSLESYKAIAEILPQFREGRIIITFNREAAGYFQRFGFNVEETENNFYKMRG